MRLGRVMGVNLRVHYFFLLPLLAWAIGGQLTEGLLAFLTVILHELGHLSTARAIGWTPKEVVLLPFGGVASVEEELGLDPAAEARVALAGPWVNVVIIGAVVIWRANFGGSPALDFFLETNIMLAAFNMLPALPLDGGRVFRAHLVREHGFKSGTVRAARVSQACSLILLLSGLGLFFFSSQSISLLVMAVFLYISAQRIRQQAPYQLMAYLAGKQREIAVVGSMPAVTMAVAPDAHGGDVILQLVPRKYHLFYVVDRAGHLQGVVSEQHLLQGVIDHGLQIQLGQLLH
ncbi:MAG: M50 family metallopeptidase [Bacillota bacterium]|jgi:stage IV sporulation protein FB